MTSDDQLILDFVCGLADVDGLLRKLAFELNQMAGVKSAQVKIVPSATASPDAIQPEYAEKGATFAFFLDSEVQKEGPNGQSIFGLSILMRRSSDTWIVEGEIGWAGGDIGWDNIEAEDKELRATAVSEIIRALPHLAADLTARYRSMLAVHMGVRLA